MQDRAKNFGVESAAIVIAAFVGIAATIALPAAADRPHQPAPFSGFFHLLNVGHTRGEGKSVPKVYV